MSGKSILASGALAGTFALIGVVIGSRLMKPPAPVIVPRANGIKPMSPPIRPEDVAPKPYADGSIPRTRPTKPPFGSRMPDFDLTTMRRGWWPL